MPKYVNRLRIFGFNIDEKLSRHFNSDGEFNLHTIISDCSVECSNTNVNKSDDYCLWFDTDAKIHSIIPVFVAAHPTLDIIYTWAKDDVDGDFGSDCGYIAYDKGHCQYVTTFTPYSRSAYDISIELCGHDQDYEYDTELDTYRKI